MSKLWAGRTDGKTDPAADAFNTSIGFDSRLFRQDIKGSMAHAAMLAKTGIITSEEAETLRAGLSSILADMESGALTPDGGSEDIHMFVEEELTARVGATGKKLHTARSRNDQVALDLRLYLRDEAAKIDKRIRTLIEALLARAEENTETVMPGYTHLQRAQPVTYGYYLMAYVMMLLRDRDRLADCVKRMNVSPIGSCALAGTTYPVDRHAEAASLGFTAPCLNAMDGVSDRDFVLELSFVLSTLMIHLSRFSEELILFSSWEFGYVELSTAYTTGSSIMPQKKNSDMAELVRGKSGRVVGDLISLLTTMKGLPLAYNKDMQEDKEPIFDAADTVKACLDITAGMVSTLTVKKDAMRAAAGKGYINATDLADYLVGKGMPFRDAYKTAGRAVALCAEKGVTLETLSLSDYQTLSPLIGADVFAAVDLDACVSRRNSFGGTAPAAVKAQIEEVKKAMDAK